MFSFFLDLKLPLRCIYKKNREARDMYVNVENVNFAYDKKPILHDINFGKNGERRNPATDSKQKQAYYTETLEQME